MTGHCGLDRAAVVLGAASALSAGLVVVDGRFDLVQIKPWGAALAVAVGVLAVLGGRQRRRVLVAIAGACLLVLAGVQLAVLVAGANPLGGDGSTIAWWLGLGVGLISVALAPRIWPISGAETDA
jgi:hypothetical protein